MTKYVPTHRGGDLRRRLSQQSREGRAQSALEVKGVGAGADGASPIVEVEQGQTRAAMEVERDRLAALAAEEEKEVRERELQSTDTHRATQGKYNLRPRKARVSINLVSILAGSDRNKKSKKIHWDPQASVVKFNKKLAVRDSEGQANLFSEDRVAVSEIFYALLCLTPCLSQNPG